MPETNSNQRFIFEQTITFLAKRRNSLLAQTYQYLGEKRTKMYNESDSLHAQMVEKTAEAVLQATQEERIKILDIATTSYTQGGTISESSKLGFVESILLKIVEINESRSPRNPKE